MYLNIRELVVAYMTVRISPGVVGAAVVWFMVWFVYMPDEGYGSEAEAEVILTEVVLLIDEIVPLLVMFDGTTGEENTR